MELKEMCLAVRKRLKLSQRELAALVGTNQTEISFIERGFIPANSCKSVAIQNLYQETEK